MRIGIFGGTFNPPHNGHLRAAGHARDALSLDRIVFVPAAIPPHKPIPPGTPSPEVRLRLTQAAIEGIPWAGVSDIEITRPGISYTADTVKIFSRENPEAGLWLLVGGDNFLHMHEWYCPDLIFSTCSVAVFAREPGTEERIAAQREALRRRYGADTAVIQMEPIVISSTELRGKIRRGEGSEHLPPRVEDLIESLGLYRNS
jgi:nicotinate-nucleotide adenylyltransferase